jgi:hypothetical protein
MTSIGVHEEQMSENNIVISSIHCGFIRSSIQTTKTKIYNHDTEAFIIVSYKVSKIDEYIKKKTSNKYKRSQILAILLVENMINKINKDRRRPMNATPQTT